jgi:hypothetical protein
MRVAAGASVDLPFGTKTTTSCVKHEVKHMRACLNALLPLTHTNKSIQSMCEEVGIDNKTNLSSERPPAHTAAVSEVTYPHTTNQRRVNSSNGQHNQHTPIRVNVTNTQSTVHAFPLIHSTCKR